MDISYTTTRRVEFADTDMAGIMHFARFFSMMEEVEHEFLRSRGLSVMMVHNGRKISWPRVAAQCDFIRPVRFEDEISVRLTLSRIGTKSLTYTAEFLLDDEVIARGTLTTCCCEVGSGGVKGIELPPDILEILKAEE